MYTPITWRTVQGPSLADASRPLDSATRTMAGGLDILKGAIAAQETTDQANWNQQKINNTQAFMNALMGARSVDEFNNLQSSGRLQQMLESGGAQIDQAAARTALDSRLGTLQQRDRESWAFANAALDQKEAPVIDQVKGLLAQGKVAEATPLIGTLSARNGAAMFEALDKRQQEEIMRARGNLKFAWEGADEAQKQVMRPLEVEAKKVSIAGQKTQNALGAVNLTKAQLDLQDAQELRNLNETVATAQQNYLAGRNEMGKNMGIVAKQLGLPLTSMGHPDFANMTTEQIKQFDDAAAAQRTVKIPQSKDFMTGDTLQANQFLADLQSSGKFRAATLNKFKDQIRSGFDTGSIGGRVGNDLFNKVLADAQAKVRFDEMDASNWNAPGAPNALKSYEALATDVPNLLDKTTGYSPAEDVADLQKFVYEMATRGVEVKPGVYLTPSVNDVRNAIRTADGGLFRDAKRAENAREIIIKSLSTPEVQKKIAEAAESQQYRRKQAVNALINPPK